MSNIAKEISQYEKELQVKNIIASNVQHTFKTLGLCAYILRFFRIRSDLSDTGVD